MLEGLNNRQVIDENDDIDYETVTREIERMVARDTRVIPPKMKQDMKETPLKTMEIGQIISSFNCTICMDLVSEPLVIKHCLHFFCKKCIDKNILQL